MATDKSWYVFTYFGHLMTEQERRAYTHLVGAFKATGCTDAASQAEARERALPHLRDLLSSDPEVLRLTSAGLDAFIERTGRRILDEHRDKITFNNCPKCGALTRTPKAQQCRFCGFDWHEARPGS
jgi:hypothetical protein